MAESIVPAQARNEHPVSLIAARIDRIPVWPYRPFIYVIVGMGFFFSFFEIGTIGPTLPKVIAATHSNTGAGALAVSLGLWGYIVGSPLNSAVSDRFGRRIALLNAMILYGIGAVGCAVSTSMPEFTVLRFVGGMGIGASIAVISTYISELSPAERRGRSMGYTTLPAVLAGAVGPFIALGLVPHFAEGWRIMTVIPVLGTVLFIAGYRLLPESPRWLAANGRFDEADRIVSEAEGYAMAKLGTSELPPVVVSAYHEPQAISFWARAGMLLRPPYVRWTLTFLLLWICQTLPAYGIGGLGVTLLVEHGYTLTTSIELTFGTAAGSLVGGLVAIYVGDRMPRKWAAAGSAVLVAAGFILLGLHTTSWLIFLAFFLSSFQTGVCSAVVYMLTAEHFPTQIRNTGMAMSDGVGHVGGALGPIIASSVFSGLGFSAVFIVLGSVYVCYVGLVSSARNTTRRPLQEIHIPAMRTPEQPVIAIESQEA